MSSSIDIKPYLNQRFEDLKRQYLRSGRLFEDSEFPAHDKSLYRYEFPRNLYGQHIQWKRPHELSQSPKFVVNDFETRDLDQGIVGNCWFIAGAVDITTSPKYLKIVVPENQTFDRNEYCGIFHFRFWRFGDWYDVVIDDRLPTVNGKLIYCSNRDCPDEFWCSLLEKAYAKLATCYEFLDGGFTQDAIVDMTGGVTEYLNIKHSLKTQSKNDLWKSIYQAHKMGSLSGANINAKNPNPNSREGKLENGLISGHAYSITKIVEVKPDNKHFSLITKMMNDLDNNQVRSRPNRRARPQRRPPTSGNNAGPQPVRNFDNNYGYDFNNNWGGGFDNNNNWGNDFNNNWGNDFNNNWGNDFNNNWGNDNNIGPNDNYQPDDYKDFDNNDNDNNDNIYDDENNRDPSQGIRLMRLRNPWGDSHEWTGAWSDGSPEWDHISSTVKQELGLINEHDGEFWMSFDDFVSNFEFICNVHVNLDAMMEELAIGSDKNKLDWECKQYHGEWVPGVNAGGSGNENYSPQYDSFWTNPQYLISLRSVKYQVESPSSAYGNRVYNRSNSYSLYAERGDNSGNDGKATLIVALMSKTDTREANRGQLGEFPKQFRIFKVRDPNKAADYKENQTKFTSNDLERIGSSQMYAVYREVSMRFRLDAGDYVIIPSTYDKNVPGKFLLRLFTESRMAVSETTVLDINNDNRDNNDDYDPKINFNDIEDKIYDLSGDEIKADDFSKYNSDDDKDEAYEYGDSDLKEYEYYKKNIKKYIPEDLARFFERFSNVESVKDYKYRQNISKGEIRKDTVKPGDCKVM